MKKHYILLLLITILIPASFSCATIIASHNESRKTYRCLVKEVDAYIKSKSDADLSAELLVYHCIRDSVPIVLALAQGQIESGLGSAGRAVKTKSIWNVGAYDNRTHKNSTSYSSFNESIPAYTSLIRTRYRSADPYRNFVDSRGLRYATDPNYEHKLSRQSSYIKSTTKIDSLQTRLKTIHDDTHKQRITEMPS